TFIDCDGDGKLDAAQIHTEAVTKVTYVGTNNITTNGLVGAQDLYGVDYTNNPKLDDINVYEGVAKDTTQLFLTTCTPTRSPTPRRNCRPARSKAPARLTRPRKSS